jgi:hypothetical protein
MVCAFGALLILVSWDLPWATAAGHEIRGMNDAVQPWFEFGISVSAAICFAGAVWLGRHRVASWALCLGAIAVAAWATIYPAAVFLAARNAAGFAGVAAADGPHVTFEVGAFGTSLGASLVVGTAGFALSRRRLPRVISAVAGTVLALTLAIGLLN